MAGYLVSGFVAGLSRHRTGDSTCLTGLSLSDILSDMKSFTVRDLDREPGVVLDECDREGAVQIRRRNGRTYTIRADAGPERMTNVPDFRARLEKIFPQVIPASQSRLVDKLIAGE
jgi:hypothetical protein